MKKCILFAAPIGAGKSPIANYLSYKLNLPVFNHDAIRTEVREDLLRMDVTEYEQRKNSRAKELINMGISFIYDASVDRNWPETKQTLLEHDYSPFIISLDFSHEKLVAIYKAKGYTEFAALDKTFAEHQQFMAEHSADVSVAIGDSQFANRLNVAFAAAAEFTK